MKSKIAIIVTIILLIIVDALFLYAVHIYAYPSEEEIVENPEDVLVEYFSLIQQEKYDDLIHLINIPNSYSVDSFTARNRNIYQGIKASDIKMEIISTEIEEDEAIITFHNSMNIRGGSLDFNNTASLTKGDDDHYKINWSSELILPDLKNEYKVRVNTISFERGSIMDRNGNILAGQGKAYTVGIIPGKLDQDKEWNIEQISQLLGISIETINKALDEEWVKDNSFVPIKTISGENTELKDQLLQVSGVMIDVISTRIYPYKDIAAHITGYVQGISIEELATLRDSGYDDDSIIGKTGLEKVYEDRLRGKNGVIVYIEDENGKNIKTLSEIKKQDGENIQLTIDINLQAKIYEQLKYDEGLFVIMNHQTGELLALISTPSYDPNLFVMGMSEYEWSVLATDVRYPLYNRFTERWIPGSTFKAITAGIGLTNGAFTTTDTFNYSGTSWKRSSWTNHLITTLSAYSGKKNLRNALVYSDNIYFAQAALSIGEETFTSELDRIKFNEKIDFAFPLAKSIYSNTDVIAGESILADSGYGQGEILVNPIHMISIYSSFVNNGNMIKPYIEYRADRTPEILVANAFSEEAANIVRDDLIQAVEDVNGTGHDVKVNGITIGGKTGTAELKAPGESTGDTLGWFDCFTVDQDLDNSLVIVSMAKNQRSLHLKAIIKTIFE